MNKLKKKVILVIGVMVLLIVGFLFWYQISLKSISKTKEEVNFVVKSGSNNKAIIKNLYTAKIIKNKNASLLYLKFKRNLVFKAGIYKLDRNMNTPQIFAKLAKGDGKSDNTFRLTFKEGDSLKKYIDNIALAMGKDSNTLIKEINSKEFLSPLINKYWFLTEDILNKNIYYPLEGYLYPNTYEFYKNASLNDIIQKILNQTEKVLNNYQKDITNSKLSVHQYLTLASIIEKEAILDEDRKTVASVFYNRLAKGMAFQSCATVGYALGEWKLIYSSNDIKIDSLYNTYKYKGFPPGPVNNPSKKSIEAAIYPDNSNYLYFIADVCNKNPKTYFSKTYNEHLQKKNKLLPCK